MDQHRVDLSLCRQVAHLFEAGANQGCAAVALIFKHPFIGNAEALLQGEGTERLRLARNCVLLLLSVRGDSCVNRCRPHGHLLRSPWATRRWRTNFALWRWPSLGRR